MRCDHLDAVTLRHVTIQTVTVVSLVANQSFRETAEEAVSEDAFDELASCGEALSALTARGRL